METTVLMTAYAVNPYKGSEDGMGWNFIYQAAQRHHVVAVTRENNQAAIERYMAAHPDEAYARIQWLYFDLPRWQRFWKKGGRGAMLYFYLWQRGVVPFLKKQNIRFDLVHNLNFHNDWTPTFLHKLGKPLVWGPVGHHPSIPARYAAWYGKGLCLTEWAKTQVKGLVRLLPSWKEAHKHAAMILKMNSAAMMPSTAKPSLLLPSVGVEPASRTEERAHPGKALRVMSAGRLVALKGFDLTLEAFARYVRQFPEATLELVGSGPEESRLKKLAEMLGIDKQVVWHPWMAREEVMALYQRADVFLFPSHEGAGMVVAEAMREGLPVVCLDNSGPGELIHPGSMMSVPMLSRGEVIEALADCLTRLTVEPELYARESVLALERVDQNLAWPEKGRYLSWVYKEVLQAKA